MRRRLLIVDDEQPVCEMLQDRLEAMGYDCVTAHDGRSALALLALSTSQSPIDGVLLDVQMPVMNGIATLREIRERYPSSPRVDDVRRAQSKSFTRDGSYRSERLHRQTLRETRVRIKMYPTLSCPDLLV